MSDWSPQVVRIEKVEKHPDADALDIVTVLGDYPVISKRDEYVVGDVACYIPIDSIVPDVAEYYFLCPKAYEKYEDANGQIQQRQLGPKYEIGSVPEKYRVIKAKKIRGIYSQGMLVHVPTSYEWLGPAELVGNSVVELLQLKKWEEQEEDNIPNAKKTRGGNQASPPKGWSIPYYDVEGLRKYVTCLLPDEEIVLTEKVHGSNAAFCHDGEQLWVKSRNFYKKMDEDDPWWDIAIRYDLTNKLAKFPNKVFFGEMYGSVKGFRYDCDIIDGAMYNKIRFFDVWDVKSGRYLDYDQFVIMVIDAGLALMPELFRGVWQGKDIMYPYAEGKTMLGGKHIREGFVLRTVKERFEPKLNSRMQVKLVGEGYNLQK
jgi:RNA ligase (TIGR02306 family)